MGCTGSRFDEMPVTGHPHGIKVLPGSERSLSVMMMTIYIYYDECLSVCHEKSSLPQIQIKA